MTRRTFFNQDDLAGPEGPSDAGAAPRGGPRPAGRTGATTGAGGGFLDGEYLDGEYVEDYELDQPVDDFDDYDPRDEEYEDFRPPGRAARPILMVFVTVVALALVGTAIGGVWVLRQIDPSGPTGEQLGTITVPKGSSVDSIATLLEAKGVITSASVFRYYAKWRKTADWKAGDYVTFHANSSMAEAIAVLDAGPVPASETALRIIPGTRLTDAFDAIVKAFPNITRDQLTLSLASGAVTSKYLPAGSTNWEGFLMPDTYRFKKDADATKILSTLVKAFDKTLDDLGYQQATALTGLGAYDLVKIASLIERERGERADEPSKISRVILNRLDRGEPLFIDASLLYGLDRRGGELSKTDLETDTPYNNRLHKGLPPTPISLPSKESLRGAIQPADGDWIYYVLVSKDPPTHFFTGSSSEFEDAKRTAKDNGVF